MLWALGTWPGGLVPAACIATVCGARERASVESPVPTPGLSSFSWGRGFADAARGKLGNPLGPTPLKPRDDPGGFFCASRFAGSALVQVEQARRSCARVEEQ